MENRRIVGVIAAIAVLGIGYALYASLTSREIEIINRRPVRSIVCLGDSITAGYGIDRNNAFPALIERSLGLPVVNAGVSGDRTAEGLERLERDVLSLQPDLVIVELGGNDFRKGVPEGELQLNLETIIQRIQATGSMVLLVGMPSGFFRDRGSQIFNETAEKLGTLLVPAKVMKGMLGRDEFTTDGIHLKEIGHQRLADALIEVISDELGD